jgi:hypothetical protein
VLDGQSYLVSYWQRSHLSRRYMIVAWHDVRRVVHDILPRLYRDIDPDSRMNVIDEEGRIVFGPPIKGGEFTVGRPFPTTLYNWQLQVALTTAEELGQKVEKQRFIELAMVTLAGAGGAGGAGDRARGVDEGAAARGAEERVHRQRSRTSSRRRSRSFACSARCSLDRVPDEEKRRHYLEIIVRESERLTALIENVLDFAKVERGKIRVPSRRATWGRRWGARWRSSRTGRARGDERDARDRPGPAARDDRRAGAGARDDQPHRQRVQVREGRRQGGRRGGRGRPRAAGAGARLRPGDRRGRSGAHLRAVRARPRSRRRGTCAAAASGSRSCSTSPRATRS